MRMTLDLLYVLCSATMSVHSARPALGFHLDRREVLVGQELST
jgi:hypothetical protein